MDPDERHCNKPKCKSSSRLIRFDKSANKIYRIGSQENDAEKHKPPPPPPSTSRNNNQEMEHSYKPEPIDSEDDVQTRYHQKPPSTSRKDNNGTEHFYKSEPIDDGDDVQTRHHQRPTSTPRKDNNETEHFYTSEPTDREDVQTKYHQSPSPASREDDEDLESYSVISEPIDSDEEPSERTLGYDIRNKLKIRTRSGHIQQMPIEEQMMPFPDSRTSKNRMRCCFRSKPPAKQEMEDETQMQKNKNKMKCCARSKSPTKQQIEDEQQMLPPDPHRKDKQKMKCCARSKSPTKQQMEDEEQMLSPDSQRKDKQKMKCCARSKPVVDQDFEDEEQMLSPDSHRKDKQKMKCCARKKPIDNREMELEEEQMPPRDSRKISSKMRCCFRSKRTDNQEIEEAKQARSPDYQRKDNRICCRPKKQPQDSEKLERFFRQELIKYLEAIHQALKVALRIDDDDGDNKSPIQYCEGTYVIVTTSKNLYTHHNEICAFMGVLEEDGFELTILPSALKQDLIFILINAPEEVLYHFAAVHRIDLMCNWEEPVPVQISDAPFKFLRYVMATELTAPNPKSAVYRRARKTLSGELPDEITTGEKAIIISKVLETTQNIDGEEFTRGINDFISAGVFQSAFPLHDGDWKWTDQGYLNDRQLLAKYWAKPTAWYKEQPLDLIQKYYGTEVAFYFAWLGFYNKMLIPAAIIGGLCFLYGLFTAFTALNLPSKELCESDIVLCPRCNPGCGFSYLKKSCTISTLTYLLSDNGAGVPFAVFMSFWATAFMQLWNRKQAILQLRWHVDSVETDVTERPAFVKSVKEVKISPITGKSELYVPKKRICITYTLTTSTIIFLMVLVICVFFAIIVYQTIFLYASTSKNGIKKESREMTVSIIASVISVIFIIIFQMIYRSISLWLTDMENPRTQAEYDNSFIYKSYTFAFVVNYTMTFYIAFFKGKFFTHPSHLSSTVYNGISFAFCDPTGCIVNLTVQLLSVVLIKYIFGNVIEVLTPILKIYWKNFRTKKRIDENRLAIWEKDYLLNQADYFYLIQEYTEMVIQYGYVIFFVAAFPLAPLLALLNNLAEIRIDARKYLLDSRRPIPKRVSGIGAWNGILQAVTYLGVVTNAFVIAFTSNFVPLQVYKYTKDWALVGYINSTLSVFKVSDGEFNLPEQNLAECYYPGKRYPPDHEKKYELTDDYWFDILIRFVVVLIFEHMVMILIGMLAYAIPDIPYSVQKHLNHKRDHSNEQEAKRLQKHYRERKKSEPPSGKISFKEQSMILNNDFL